MQVTATELKNRLGQYLEAAQAEAIEVNKSGRLSAVVLSKKRYDELLKLEDLMWDIQAQQAEAEGFMDDGDVRELMGK